MDVRSSCWAACLVDGTDDVSTFTPAGERQDRMGCCKHRRRQGQVIEAQGTSKISWRTAPRLLMFSVQWQASRERERARWMDRGFDGQTGQVALLKDEGGSVVLCGFSLLPCTLWISSAASGLRASILLLSARGRSCFAVFNPRSAYLAIGSDQFWKTRDMLGSVIQLKAAGERLMGVVYIRASVWTN